MKKKTYLLCLTALFAVSLFGCARVTDEDIPSQKAEIETPVSESVNSISEPASRYIINKESAITNDLEYFGIEMVNGDVTLALSDLCAIFPDEEQYYLYFRMPEDSEYDAYRINSMCINGRDHVVELLEIDGSYQKYAISDWTVSADNVYEISGKFVVVDLTHQNNGAYFEEGYAMGLGKPVIQLCQIETKLHFDIAQKNSIMWQIEDDIPQKLCNRIKATID